MNEPGKAVFLSYASQDADAAKKICDALRASGVEVWFDQSELVGGDAWDQKIRKQIRECALLIPVISKTTQGRREAYFRLEWRLAEERTHLMAKGTPFLLPVTIDETSDRDALVPDAFLAVQWTKAPGGEVPVAFAARVKKLLGGDVGRDRDERVSLGGPIPPPAEKAGSGDPALQRSGPRWLRPVLASAALVIAVLAGTLIKDHYRTTPAEKPPTPPDAPAASEFPRDPDLRRAYQLIYSFDAIPEDFSLADDLVKPLLAARPNDPEVVTVAAVVSQEYATRGFDTTEARRALAQRLTERAVQLAPGNPMALGALGRYLLYVNSQLGRAEELVRRAIELAPKESRYYRTLYSILAATKPSEVEEFGTRMVARFPNDVLVHYDIARGYKDANNLGAMEEWIDRTLAIGPLTGALVWKAWLRLEVHGDVAGMKQSLDRIPERQRTSPRVVAAFAVRAGITGETALAGQLANALSETWLSDFDFTGPKALLAGDLLRQDGIVDLARVQYEAALAEIQRAEAREPTNLRFRRAEMWAHIGLGNHDQARAALQLVVQGQNARGVTSWNLNYSWWNGVIRAALLLDERDQALVLFRQVATDSSARQLLRSQFHLDPRVARFHDDPEINALITEPAEQKTSSFAKASEDREDGGRKTEDGKQQTENGKPVAVDSKSVAVLAFANLSDDKNNEYFSDGISEELLNVLAKVPGLKVSARTSSFHFKGTNTEIPEIARQLGVAYVVEGSVRKSGDKVRITAQLIKAADGFHVWSDTFTRELKDVFVVQDEIAGLIAKNLELKIVSPATAAATIDPEAYRLYLEGRQILQRRTLESYTQAEKFFDQARAIAPAWAQVYVGLADAARLRTFGPQTGPKGPNSPWTPDMKKAKALADHALELDPSLAGAYVALGGTYMLAWNFPEAERLSRRAIELNPNEADAYLVLGRILSAEGRMDESIEALRRSADLNPLAPRILDNLAAELDNAGRYLEAWEIIERAHALQPDSSQIQCYRVRLLAKLGRRDEALALARQMAANSNPEEREFRLIEVAHAYAIFGMKADAEAALAQVPVDAAEHVIGLSYLGKPDQAIPGLDLLTFGWVEDLLWGPGFDPIRRDPGYLDYLARTGLTESDSRARAWRAAHPPESGGRKAEDRGQK